MDEIFFVDLPDTTVRKEIFRIHLAKRDLDPATFDLHALASAAHGFTGAEIEEAIVSARYLALRGKVVSTDDVVNAINRTFPISALRAESIESLRQWAKGRTVAA